MPQVAFLITGFNPGDTVRAAVLSALEQNMVDQEVIYVDDGSTDGSADVVRSLNDPRVQILQPGRVGRARALNLGVDRARAPLVAILDADDRALPLRARLQVDFLNSHPEIVAVGGQLLVTTRSGRRDRSRRMAFPVAATEIDAWLRRGRMALAHPALTFRRSWFEGTGGYDPSVLRAEDFDLILRGWSPGCYAALPVPLTVYESRLFPTWRYWRTETSYSAAIHRRWERREVAPLRLTTNRTELVSSWMKWGVQSMRARLQNRTWSLE